MNFMEENPENKGVIELKELIEKAEDYISGREID